MSNCPLKFTVFHLEGGVALTPNSTILLINLLLFFGLTGAGETKFCATCQNLPEAVLPNVDALTGLST